MSVLVNEKSRIVVQGLTGKEGTFHALRCKEYGTRVVGGVTPGKGGATHEGFPFPAAQARVREAYDRFGPDRLLWGSNYPLTTRVCTYTEAVDLIRVACGFLTEEDKAKVLGDTARKVFRLPW